MNKMGVSRDLIIGIAFLGALVLMGAVTLKVTDLTDLPFVGSPQDLTVPFDSVNGLRPGDDVRILGFRVGLVKGIDRSFDSGGLRVLVTCRMTEDFPLPPDSVFQVRSAGPLGGRFIEIVPGAQDAAPLAVGRFQGRAEGDLFEQLRDMVGEIRHGNGLLSQLIVNEKLGNDFAEAISDVRQVIKAVHDSEGLLGTLIKDTALRDKIVGVVDDVSRTMADVNGGKGALGMLVNDSEVRDQAKKVIANLEEISSSIREGKGSLGRIINDPTLHDDAVATLNTVQKLVERLEKGEGTLGMLLADETFRGDLRETVASVRKTMEKIERGEGTLGALVNEREVYERLSRILARAEDAIEDLREQAPINTFVNVLFSAF